MFSTFAFAEAPFSYEGLPDQTISIVGVSGVSVSAFRIISGSAAIDDTSTVTATGFVDNGISATSAAQSSVVAIGTKIATVAVNIDSTSEIIARGSFSVFAFAALTSTSSVSATAGYKWLTIEDTSEIWTTVNDQSENWTTVTG
jgi:hypothetical protein